MSDSPADDITTLIQTGMADVRSAALGAAAEICESIAAQGGCAECCAQAIRSLKARFDTPPHATEVALAVLEKPDRVN